MKSLKFSKDLHFFITCVLSWGILEATHVLTFFIFAFALQILFFFRDHGPLTNVKISKFGNFENHAILDQIRLVTSLTTMILKDKSFDIKIAKI